MLLTWAVACRAEPPSQPAADHEDLDWPAGLDYATLRRAWESRGRAWIQQNAAVAFEDGHWRAAPESLPRQARGSKAYYVQYATEVGVEMATQCNDADLEEELLELFLFLLRQFESIEAFAASAPAAATENRFEREQLGEAKTLGWLEGRGERGGRFRECELCMSQWFHPPARLLHWLAIRPSARRSARAARFLEELWPILVHDHLVRLSPENRPDLWDTDVRVTDRQLWMGATAAHALAAHTADSSSFPLSDADRRVLSDLVARATRALQVHRHDRFEGGSHLLSFFDGVETATPAYAYAGRQGRTLPNEPAQLGEVGWDVSHYHRLPIILRSLYDTRHATGERFPTRHDLEAAGNHFAHRVYVPAPAGPYLRNYSDGSDGWYRVEPERDFGIPPAPHCDATDTRRPCLTGPALMGWGLLHGSSDSLDAMMSDFAEVAAGPPTKHRARLLTFNGEPFAVDAASGAATLVLFVFAAAPRRLPGCVPSPGR